VTIVPTPPNPTAWPVGKDGFRLRGQDMTRTEAFTDAAFAFAVTLLVISVDAMPSSFQDLADALRGVPAFAMSFTVLLVFWHGHWQWSRRYGLEDRPSIVLSATLVFVALVYVYPLKYVSNLFLYWLTSGRLSGSARLSGLGELHAIFAIYGVGFMAMSLVVAALNLHAWRLREELLLNDLERLHTRGETGAWFILAAVGGLSVLLAVAAPPTPFVLPGWAYSILPIVMWRYGASIERKRRLLEA
jgi:uncharacterized membrane protein